jgi:Rps23 Pro-64 3,4-dihydroxylase Tpa1-like proline 4-hydroxylase
MFTAEAFSAAQPFPHAIVPDFVPIETVRAINAEWPTDGWNPYKHKHSDKRASTSFGPRTKELVDSLNGPEFIESLSKMTGISNLSADPWLSGGGLHETLNGGFLDIHADFNIHPKTRLFRRLNLLLFLNEDWQDEWGGCLELWNQDKSGACVCVAPNAGTAVIFATTDSSFHGHPVPLNRPDGGSRRSIALYYYSPESPEPNPREHSTLYIGEEEHWFRTD